MYVTLVTRRVPENAGMMALPVVQVYSSFFPSSRSPPPSHYHLGMSDGRKLRTARGGKPLAAGEKLQRDRLAAKDLPTWGWVKDINNVSDITLDHLLATCNLGESSAKPLCPSKYPIEAGVSSRSKSKDSQAAVTAEDDGDSIVVISDSEEVQCTKKGCVDNPNCLNYLGQEKWENEGDIDF